MRRVRSKSQMLPLSAALTLGLLVSGLLMSGLVACATPEQGPTAQRPVTQKEDAMMVIRVVVKVKPDQEEAFQNYIQEEALAVRKMAGCDRYAFYADTTEPQTYLLYEEWASAEAFDAYKQSPALKKSFEVLGPMMAGPPDSAYFAAQIVK